MLAWDAASTFSCFFYPAGGLQWSQSSTMHAAGVMVRPLIALHMRTSLNGFPLCCQLSV